MWDSSGHISQDDAPLCTRSVSGELLSPFDTGRELPSYSSSEGDVSDEDDGELPGYLLAEGSGADNFLSTTWAANNSVGSWEGMPSANHPNSVVEAIEHVSAVSFSRNNVFSTGVNDMVRELERLGMEGGERVVRSEPVSGLVASDRGERKPKSPPNLRGVIAEGVTGGCDDEQLTLEHMQDIQRTQIQTLDEKTMQKWDDDDESRSSCSLGIGEEEDTLSWLSNVQVTWRQIGQGSYGRVFKAMIGDQLYALKVVEASRRCQLRKLACEARANMLLKHENVVNCFKCCALTKGYGRRSSDQEETPLELWMLQELCEGGTLDEAIRRPWMYPPGNDAASRENILIKLSTQIARGLEYIHSHGHIHGDLSSNNVLLSLPPDHSYPAHQTHANSTADASDHRPDDTSDTPSYSDPRMWENVTLKISDFGRSKEKEFGSCRTDSIGTVTFMPPETLTAGSLQPSADIYSYGVILIQLWAGKLPYQNYNFAQIIFEASQGRTPPVPEDMVAPRYIKEIIRQCLSPLSSERPTATEILGMFNGVPRISVAEEDEQDSNE